MEHGKEAWGQAAAQTEGDLGDPLHARSEASPQEPPLSPIFIRNPIYGTRCSTLVAVDEQGNGFISERRYTSAGEVAGETALSFLWPAETNGTKMHRK